MKKQRIYEIVILVLLVLCVIGAFFMGSNSHNTDMTNKGGNSNEGTSNSVGESSDKINHADVFTEDSYSELIYMLPEQFSEYQVKELNQVLSTYIVGGYTNTNRLYREVIDTRFDFKLTDVTLTKDLESIKYTDIDNLHNYMVEGNENVLKESVSIIKIKYTINNTSGSDLYYGQDIVGIYSVDNIGKTINIENNKQGMINAKLLYRDDNNGNVLYENGFQYIKVTAGINEVEAAYLINDDELKKDKIAMCIASNGISVSMALFNGNGIIYLRQGIK